MNRLSRQAVRGQCLPAAAFWLACPESTRKINSRVGTLFPQSSFRANS